MSAAPPASEVWDLHAHAIPSWLVADMRAGSAVDGIRTTTEDGRELVVHRQGPRYPLVPGLHEVEARLEAMDASGIDRAVVSLSPTLLLYWLEEGEARDFARAVNEELARLPARSGGRLLPLAHLPMQDPDSALDEAVFALDELGMAGCQVAPMIADRPLDDSGYERLLAAVAERGAPVTLHPYFVGVGQRAGLESYYLTNLVGHPYQTCVGASRLIMSGLLDRVPDLRVVLVHGGGYLPYQIGRLDHGHEVRPEARECERKPSAYLRRFHFDTITHSAQSLSFLVGLVGADRVVYGTDYPYDMGGGTLPAQLAGTDLPDADRALIASGNARDLYARRLGGQTEPQEG